jgi:hypothetical protein
MIIRKRIRTRSGEKQHLVILCEMRHQICENEIAGKSLELMGKPYRGLVFRHAELLK